MCVMPCFSGAGPLQSVCDGDRADVQGHRPQHTVGAPGLASILRTQ